MLDTVKFRLKEANSGQVESVYDSLKKNRATNDTVPESFNGTIKNIHVKVNKYNTITIEGSLSEYYYGDNVNTLNYNDLILAIKQLETDLGIILDEAKLIRLDISSVLITNYSPTVYISSFLNRPNKDRAPIGKSLYYLGGKDQCVIYDKKKKVKANDGNNYLRFEYRLLNQKKVMSILKIERVFDLKSGETFNRLLNQWYDFYKSINKRERKYDDKHLKNSKDVSDFIYDKGIEALGGVPATLEMIDQLQLAGNLDSKIAYRCRKSVVDSYIGTSECQNELVNELNQTFKNEYDRLLIL